MNIQLTDINKINAYANNPRNNEDAVLAVAESIQEFGFKNPIIVDKDYTIIAGHTRILAAQKLGISEVPVIVADDLTEEQVRAFRIADNKTNEIAEWNLEMLAEELKGLEEIFTGFDQDEFQEMMGLDQTIEEDEYDIEEPVEPKTKPNEIYQLGQHRLMVGDSTDTKAVQTLMEGHLADLVVTDPPYNVNYEGQKGMKIENDNQEEQQFLEFLTDTFQAMKDNLKEGGAYYIWHADEYAFIQALRAVDMKERQRLIWVKSSMVLGRQDYQWKHEPCLYGWKSGAAHYFIDDFTNTTVIEDAPNINAMNKDQLKDYIKELIKQRDAGSTIIREDKPTNSDLHPTMKPVKLMAYQVQNSSKRKERVLDLFGGSGSTLMACEQLDRKAYIMELEPKYADVIIDRWEQYTGETAERVSE